MLNEKNIIFYTILCRPYLEDKDKDWVTYWRFKWFLKVTEGTTVGPAFGFCIDSLVSRFRPISVFYAFELECDGQTEKTNKQDDVRPVRAKLTELASSDERWNK